jgi:acyl-CoA synthetase (AMP-forming)/AMP-acid ligase II
MHAPHGSHHRDTPARDADANQALTYAKLGRASNAVANAILGLAGDQAQRVVLLVDQGVAAVTATLAH